MRFSLWPRRRQEDLDEEIQGHLQMAVRDRMDRGESPQHARDAARRELGNAGLIKEVTREMWAWASLERFMQDVRYGLRMLARAPAFTAVAILTLALGIGANTAIFSIIDAVLLGSLPVKDPQELVVFTWTAHHRPKYTGHSDHGDCEDPKVDCSLSVPFFKTVRSQANTFSAVAAFAGPLDIDFSGNGPATMARGTWVSGDFFSTLGVNTVLGRPLVPSDDSPSAPPAIVLDYGYWQRAFGGDRSALGRTVRLNNVFATIVGIADPHFTNLTPGKTQDFFMPLSLSSRVQSEWWGDQDRLSDPAVWWVVILGRLKPGVSISQAQAAATTIFRNELLHGLKPLSTEADAPAISLLPAREGLNGESSQIAPMLYLVMVAVGLVLLIACANVAGLMLARSATRQKEMAVRLALGAGRARITRQLLTESMLLSFIGGALGILIAIWGIQAIVALLSSGYGPFSYAVAPDWRVLAFTIGVTLATGILFGLAPALRSARVDLTPSLKENASSLPGGAARTGRWFRLGDALVIAQVALSIVVLIGAGLLVRTLRNLHNLNPGFDTRNILLFGIDPTIAGYKDQQTAQLYRDLQQRFAALPGVISASYSENSLLSGSWSADRVHLDGAPPKSNINPATLTVGTNFFSTMRIPILAGRAFTSADFAVAAATNAAQKAAEAAAQHAPGSSSSPASAPRSVSATSLSALQAPPVPVMINEAFARKVFPNQNPLGKHMGDAQEEGEPAIGPQPGYLIVGLVGDTKYRDLRREILPTMYLPLVSNSAHFELRTAADPTALVTLVRGIVSRADNNLPLFDVRTQTEQIEQTLFQERLMSRLSSFFGLLALVLACIGLYGLLSYEVARRTRELGIRMALGAQQRDLLRLVVGQGIFLALVGAAVGIAAGIGVTRFMTSMLYGVHANDPLTIVGVVILLMLVGLAACYIPARRGSKTDPAIALRHE
jgi:macrolide transport system ATP-binding/permease protein